MACTPKPVRRDRKRRSLAVRHLIRTGQLLVNTERNGSVVTVTFEMNKRKR